MDSIIENSVVSADWLNKNLNANNLVILNGTLNKVTSNPEMANIEEYQIKNSIFFDIKNHFSDSNAQFPNTVLPPKKFEERVRKLGINNSSCIIVYDEYGIYSSARVWWLFKLMGHTNIAVLDGGFPLWKSKNYPIERKQSNSTKIIGDFVSKLNPRLLVDYSQVLINIDSNERLLLDARSYKRFRGLTPEPRKQVRSGHIPSSMSLPYSMVIDNSVSLKNKKDLTNIFNQLNINNKDLIFSCGSGITACILALAAEVVGNKKYSVYDGSWTEWGSLKELPIEK